MKTIGLIGGMSWESTLSYYKAINQGVKKQLGGLHSAKLVLVSVDFDEIEKLQHQGKWQETADILSNAAVSIEKAGADFFLICTNTMHKVAEQVQKSVNIPLLHIADATAQELVESNISKVGLLGTAFTMEQDFYKGRLSEKFGIEVLVPNPEQRAQVHQIIYQELCLGKVEPESKVVYLDIVDELYQQGCEAVILGCTEIALLIQKQDTKVPLYDTTQIHAERAIEVSLKP
jgi:aspartate racemase